MRLWKVRGKHKWQMLLLGFQMRVQDIAKLPSGHDVPVPPSSQSSCHHPDPPKVKPTISSWEGEVYNSIESSQPFPRNTRDH